MIYDNNDLTLERARNREQALRRVCSRYNYITAVVVTEFGIVKVFYGRYDVKTQVKSVDICGYRSWLGQRLEDAST
jgi:hypothetical protein